MAGVGNIYLGTQGTWVQTYYMQIHSGLDDSYPGDSILAEVSH